MSLNTVSCFRKQAFSRHVAIAITLLLVISIFSLIACKSRNSSSVLIIPGDNRDDTPSIPAAAVRETSIIAVAGDGKVTLTWSPVSSVTSYDVYRSTISGNTGTLVASVSSSITSYVDTSVANGTPYYFQVAAFNGVTQIGMSSQVSATPGPQSGTVTISGYIQYQDKIYNASGFILNSQPYKAVRYATVDLVSAADSSVLTSRITDSMGFYSFANIVPPSSPVYLRVNAEATLSGSQPQIIVKDLSGLTGRMYSVAGANFTASGSANADISVSASSIGGVFNMLDVFTNGFQFVHSLSGQYPTRLSGFWEQNDSFGGSFYCDTGSCSIEGIFVTNESGVDTDEYDDDVLYHEFGHFIAAHFSIDDSQGGYHYLGADDVDMRLAWSEGWADAMPGNIKMSLYAANPELLSCVGTGGTGTAYLTEYIDTAVPGTFIAIDMDGPDGTPNYYNHFYYYYASNEIAIARVLLEINKTIEMQPIWDVISSYTASTPTRPVNLESFWDRWRSLRTDTFAAEQTTLENIFDDRQIYYREDPFEAAGDDTFSSATRTVVLPLTETHYLYKTDGTPDKDVILFTANTPSQQFTIQTSVQDSIKNGADTYIRILDASGNYAGSSNDNWNSGTYSQFCGAQYQPNCPINGDYYDFWGNYQEPAPLGSKLVFIAPVLGNYYVEVSTSPNLPPSAGRYGSYTLNITSP